MKVPNHVAIILDGNGRWAKAKGMPRTYGHIKGCENLEKICSIAKELGVKYLTVYAFSTENWKRSKEEVEWIDETVSQLYEKMHQNFCGEQNAGEGNWRPNRF